MSRSYVREIFKNIINSITRKNVFGELRGKDYMGTKYYETPLTKNSSQSRPHRWFVPVEKNNFQQEIPPEWTAWLRHRRNDPPTEEEIQMNLCKMKQTIEKAKKLEKPRTVKSDQDEVKSIDKPSFPVYEDYEIPDSSLKRKKKNSY